MLAYVTSTRPGHYQGSMSADAIPTIYRHLQELDLDEKEPKLDLFLHTNGGESTVPWRLMSLLREFASAGVDLLVPHRAYSSGTLAALGADSVVMHPMGVLGPTDTSIVGPYNPEDHDGAPIPIPVEDVLSYIEWVKADVGIRHEDELVKALGFLTDKVNPMALGNVKRSVLQSRMMGAKLLGIRRGELDQHNAEEIVSSLAQRLFYHGHPINRSEAKEDLHLDWVREATPEEEQAMWNLYESYQSEMRLDCDFSLVREAIAKNQKVPEIPSSKGKSEGDDPAPTVVDVELDPQQLVWVESKDRADCREEDLTVTLVRNARGRLNYNYVLRDDAWRRYR